MNILFIWLLAYVLPALSADILIALFPEHKPLHERSAIIMHTALVLSAVASQYALHALGQNFPWHFDVLSVSVYAVGVLLSFMTIRTLGVWYGLSALVQEFAMLSISFLLLTIYPLWLVLILIVPIFVFSHPLRAKHWVIRLVLILLWGIASVSLFSVLHNVWIIAALHATLGAFLIKQSILYPSVRLKRKVRHK